MVPYKDDYCVPARSGRLAANEWINSNGARLHRGLAPPSYNEQRAKSPVRPLEKDVFQQHADHFNAALSIYKSSNKDALKDLELGKAHNWDEVSRVYQDAQLKYAEKGKGWLGFPRRIGRSMGDNAPSVVYPWLTFIPEGTYTTLLRSGLFLIFGAAVRLSERRRLILETFCNIPFLVQHAEYSFEDFYRDLELKRLVTELYLSILETIMTMMEWLVEKPGWKQIKGILQGPGYGRNLEDTVKDMQQQISAIDTRVSRLTRGAVVSTFATATKIDLRVDELGNVAQSIKADTKEIKAVTKNVTDVTGEIKASVSNLGTNLSEQQKSNEKALSHIINVLDETKRTSEWNHKGWQEAERRKEELEKSEKLRQEAERRQQETETKLQVAMARVHERQGMLVRCDELLEQLDVDPAQILTDIGNTVRDGQGMDFAVHGRGHMLMHQHQFQEWLSSAQSKCLLVDGNAETSMQRISAMSVVCALLAQNLPGDNASVVVHFCGIRAGQEGGLSGPTDLIRQLLAQIVRTHNLDTRFVENRAYQELEHFDLRRLCLLFIEMVKRLPRGTVLFCIIDGITWIEDETCLRETCYVVRKLTDLTQDWEVRSVFKLLITSPLASRYVAEQIPSQDRLSLLHEVAESDGTPLTGRHVMSHSPNPREDFFEESLPDIDSDEGFVDGGFEEGTVLHDDD